MNTPGTPEGLIYEPPGMLAPGAWSLEGGVEDAPLGEAMAVKIPLDPVCDFLHAGTLGSLAGASRPRRPRRGVPGA
jgi:hypothetical protein